MIGWVVAAILPRLVVRLPDLLQEHQAHLLLVGVWIGLGFGISALAARIKKGTYA